jgi:hypothetical protein
MKRMIYFPPTTISGEMKAAFDDCRGLSGLGGGAGGIRTDGRLSSRSVSTWTSQTDVAGKIGNASIALPEGELEEIDRLLSAATDDDVCNDLLRTIRNAGRWVEQETIAERVLDPQAWASSPAPTP